MRSHTLLVPTSVAVPLLKSSKCAAPIDEQPGPSPQGAHLPQPSSYRVNAYIAMPKTLLLAI